MVTGYSWEIFDKQYFELLVALENGRQYLVDFEKENIKELKELKSTNPCNIIVKLNSSYDNHFILCSSKNGNRKIHSIFNEDEESNGLISSVQNLTPIIDIDLIKEHENEFFISTGGNSSKDDRKLRIIQKGIDVNPVLKSDPNYKGYLALSSISKILVSMVFGILVKIQMKKIITTNLL